MNIPSIFQINSAKQFNAMALEMFRFQYHNNDVYREFCMHFNRSENNVSDLSSIPFLPIDFFKTKAVIQNELEAQLYFTSSGTTVGHPSKHYIADIKVYEHSFLTTFEKFYGPPDNYCILALLPSYLERTGSSLIYMVDTLIKKSKHNSSGFYLHNLHELSTKLTALDAEGTKVILIGVSYALLDLIELGSFALKHTIIMETGGMKGRRKEMVKEELHKKLMAGFGVSEIHSEYGMTELLSQAYSSGHGIFRSPPWMKVLCRDTEDPLKLIEHGKTGGINIIDLANVHSCSFIATQDLGQINKDGSFKVMGRFDHADIRGCNLMIV